MMKTYCATLKLGWYFNLMIKNNHDEVDNIYIYIYILKLHYIY